MSSKKTDLLSVLEGNSESSEGLASSGSNGGDESNSEEDEGRKPLCEWKGTKSYFGKAPRGVHSLLYFAYMCVRDLFIGGFFTLQKRV
jgi:hypothetical protein